MPSAASKDLIYVFCIDNYMSKTRLTRYSFKNTHIKTYFPGVAVVNSHTSVVLHVIKWDMMCTLVQFCWIQSHALKGRIEGNLFCMTSRWLRSDSQGDVRVTTPYPLRHVASRNHSPMSWKKRVFCLKKLCSTLTSRKCKTVLCDSVFPRHEVFNLTASHTVARTVNVHLSLTSKCRHAVTRVEDTEIKLHVFLTTTVHWDLRASPSGCFASGERSPVPIWQGGGLAPRPAGWRNGEEANLCSNTGYQAYSQWLQWPSYSGVRSCIYDNP